MILRIILEFGAVVSNFAAVTKALDRTSNNLDRLAPTGASTARNVALADIADELWDWLPSRFSRKSALKS